MGNCRAAGLLDLIHILSRRQGEKKGGRETGWLQEKGQRGRREKKKEKTKRERKEWKEGGREEGVKTKWGPRERYDNSFDGPQLLGRILIIKY